MCAPITPSDDWAALERDADERGDAFARMVREETGGFLEGPSTQAAHEHAPDEKVEWLSGAVPGVTILREIGRGGMGVVYEGAEVSTGRRVAVKLLHADRRTPGLVRRLQREAQALGRIEHPGVTRLYSAGVCGSPLAGSPYFIMELVRGVDPLAYADAHNLDTRARAELGMRIAEAVGAAHRQRVLHLDLKPGNVLVREDGSVKVLDFGIARVLDDSPGAGTMTLLTHPFGSSESMSPEQFDGRAGSAASDVFSLGVLLYRLLAGRHPFDVEGVPLAEASRRVATDACPPMRKFHRTIPRDLDVVALTALAKSPRERYPNAAALADDLRPFIQGEPITARRPGLWRRAKMYAAKHRALTASSAAASLTLILGAAAATTQAVRASRAETRAVERLEDVRDLAGSMIFEMYDEIEDLPGATGVREAILTNALEYLDRLERDADADTGLRLELARGLTRVAEVLFSVTESNSGDLVGARASAERAVEILNELDAEFPDDRDIRLALARARLIHDWYRPSPPRHEIKDFETRLRRHQETLAIVQAVLDEHPDDREAALFLAECTTFLGHRHHNDGREDEAIEAHRKSVGLYRALVASDPSDGEARVGLANALFWHGHYLYLQNKDGAREVIDDAIDLAAQMLESRPWSVRLRSRFASGLVTLAMLHSRAGEYDEALAAHATALSTIALLREQDPFNTQWLRQMWVCSAMGADTHAMRAQDPSIALGDRLASAREGLAMRRRALEITLERVDLGALPEWESHYVEDGRQKLDEAERVLRELEAKITVSNARGQ